MLGRGLESLIPKKEDKGKQGNEDKNTSSAPSVQFFSSDNPEFKKDLTDSLPKPEEDSKFIPSGHIPQGSDVREIKPEKDFQEFPKKHQEAIFLLELDEIKPNPFQPRRHFDEESLKELAASIQEFGILQPLLVSKIEEETENGTKVSYQLIAGERRFLAAKMLGLERVPAIIKKIDLESNRLEIAIIENIQRADLNPIESARAFAKLQDEFRLTQREIAQRVGKSREAVANTLRLLSLPTNIQDALAQKKINESQARTLLAVSDLNQQQALFQDLVNNSLSVRDLREKINPEEPAGQPKDPEAHYLETQLEEALGTKVQVSKNQNKGKIVIKFFSPEELDAIIKKICQSEPE
ncbi:MAG: ParB/RepB/Spo0J family partition protein [Candidatus Paceibacterota bacterium]